MSKDPVIDLFKPRLFDQPNRSRRAQSRNVSLGELVDRNFGNTGSFRFASPSEGLISTQQINIDYSDFTNHTFFDSAVSKVNVAFDRLINHFPFDGARKEIEEFVDSLTGFENWVYQQFPKHAGYLNFSGSGYYDLNKEFVEGDSSEGSYINVRDASGLNFPDFSSNGSGDSALAPKGSTFTIDTHILASTTGGMKNQVICQMAVPGVKDRGFLLALSDSNDSTTSTSIIFSAVSGSSVLTAKAPFKKGTWQRVVATYDRHVDENNLKLYINETLEGTSFSADMSEFYFNGAVFTIGSGSSMQTGSIADSDDNVRYFTPHQTFSGSLEEFRFFHSPRTVPQQQADKFKNVYTDAINELKLYFKFNEPTGSHGMESVVLDSSGNSLHSYIENYSQILRLSRSFYGEDIISPIKAEDRNTSPVLFPNYFEVANLNERLLSTGSSYDNANPNLITKLIPGHYLEEGQQIQGLPDQNTGLLEENTYSGASIPGSGKITSSQIITGLLLTWAKFFDELKIFIDDFSNILYPDYDSQSAVSDKFLIFASRYYGIKLPRIFEDPSIAQYIDGEDLEIDFSKSASPLHHVQNQIWRRMLTNLNEIVKSKGTIHGIESLIRTMGIEPRNNFRIREFGGPSTRKLTEVREERSEASTLLDFSGSLGDFSTARDVTAAKDAQGFLKPEYGYMPRLQSCFLSASRVETGTPEIQGTFVDPDVIFGVDRLGSFAKATGKIIVTGHVSLDGTVTIISTDGTSKAYIAKAAQDLTTDPPQFARSTGAVGDVAASIKACIESANGHDGKIIVTLSTTSATNDTINITQNSIIGHGGNTTISTSGASQLTVTSFSGGRGLLKVGSYVRRNVDTGWRHSDGYHGPGISDNPEDGLLTSGSWTYEAIYKFPVRTTGSYNLTQSLMRLAITGTSQAPSQSMICNLVAYSGSSKVTLFARPKSSTSLETAPLLNLPLTGVNLFDGKKWNVSFGRFRNDLIGNMKSGSWFLRCARPEPNGKLREFYASSTLYVAHPAQATGDFSCLENKDNENLHGAFILIGSQSIGYAYQRFLHHAAFTTDTELVATRETSFEGEVGHIRWWTKGFNEDQWKEHVRNYKSLGTDKPLKNFNFNTWESGSFERLRLNCSTDQPVTKSDSNGQILLTDFSQNKTDPIVGSNFVITGSGFEPSVRIIKPEKFFFSMLSPKFDTRTSNEKVRIRGYLNEDRIKEKHYASAAPVYEIFPGEEPDDDTRFSIDFSCTQALDEDIMCLFNSYDLFESALGDPRLMYDDFYPELDQMQKIYFNRLTQRLDLKTFFDFFKWFDTTFTSIIEQIIPRKAEFLGVNYVIESHVLERHRFRFQGQDIYLNESERDIVAIQEGDFIDSREGDSVDDLVGEIGGY